MSDATPSSGGSADNQAQDVPGFAAMPNWLVRDRSVSIHDKMVYLVLASHVTRDDSWYMTHRQIATEARMSVSSVQRSLDRLRDAGLITWKGRIDPDSGARLGNSYRVYSTPLGRPDRPPRSVRPTPSVPVTEQKKNPEEEPIDTPPTPSAEEHGNEIDARFEEAWLAWPKKTGKAEARRRFTQAIGRHKNAVRNGEVPAAPLDAAVWGSAALLRDTVSRFGHAYARTTPPQYIPMLSTWLNQQRWTDPLPVDRTRGAHQPEPQRPKQFVIPPGHRLVRDELGHIIGTEPAQ